MFLPCSLLALLPSEEVLARHKCDKESYNHVCLESMCANVGIEPSDEVYEAACPERSGLKKMCIAINILSVDFFWTVHVHILPIKPSMSHTQRNIYFESKMQCVLILVQSILSL